MQWFQVRKYIFCFKNVLILEFFLWPIKLIVTDCTAIFDLNVNTTLTFSTNDVSCNVIKVKFYSNLCFLNLSKVIHKKLLENYVYLLSNSIHREEFVLDAAVRSSSCNLFWEVERHNIYPLLKREYSHLMFSPSGIINSAVESLESLLSFFF